MSKGKCVMDNCDRELFYKNSGLCAPCYQALYYWRKKSVTEIMQRKNKLRVFISRMDTVEPKVSVMTRKKQRRG